MLGFNKAKQPDVLSHWYTLVDYFNISSEDFYNAVQVDLKNRKVPGLKMASVVFSEGGFFSAKRIYLRMKRERLVFDICAAPFGTSYFFSMRFAELPQGGSWWRWIPLFAGILWIWRFDGLWIWQVYYYHWSMPIALISHIVLALLGVAVLWLVVVWIENQLRRDSYYRQDTRLMYLEVVNTVVKTKIAEFTSEKGIHLLDIRQHSPLMDNLYRTTQVNIQPVEPLPEPVAA